MNPKLRACCAIRDSSATQTIDSDNCFFRYVKPRLATVETAKHRTFQFLGSDLAPDNMLICVASADAFHLGVLSSGVHVVWALATGGTLEDRPRHNKSRCFEPFPFPVATATQEARIRDLAERLDTHRKRQQAAHPALTPTGLYNVLEKPCRGDSLDARERIIHDPASWAGDRPYARMA